MVGVAPGAAQGGLTAGGLLHCGRGVGGAGALAESFRRQDGLDTVAVARKFYATHGDDYQQLVVYTSRSLVPGGHVRLRADDQEHRQPGIGLASWTT